MVKGTASPSDQGSVEKRIERRAYEIWEREGRPHGRHHEHWLRARDELAAEGGKADALASVSPYGQSRLEPPARPKARSAKRVKPAAPAPAAAGPAGTIPAAPDGEPQRPPRPTGGRARGRGTKAPE